MEDNVQRVKVAEGGNVKWVLDDDLEVRACVAVLSILKGALVVRSRCDVIGFACQPINWVEGRSPHPLVIGNLLGCEGWWVFV